MATPVSILTRHFETVLEQLATTGRPVLISKHGVPVAALIAVDPDPGELAILASLDERYVN
jgi:prevent-host-death family protein